MRDYFVMSHLTMQHFISPTFTHEKLVAPSYNDLVDVFEDRMLNWFFLPASKLLDISHCEIAAVSLLLNYFEGIEIYLSGQDSKNRSGEFFARAFERVFPIKGHPPKFSCKIIAALYSQVRCGFSHDNIFRDRVYFSRARPNPILITWPKKDGNFDHSAEIESICINPPLLYNSIKAHFEGYIKTLRDGVDVPAKLAFKKTVALKWGLDNPGPFIGMTEDDFFKV